MLLVLQISALTISCRRSKKFKLLKYLPIYISFGLAQNIFFLFSLLDLGLAFRLKYYKVNDYIIYIFTIIEITIFTLLYNSLFSINRKVTNSILLSLIIGYCLFLLLTNPITNDSLTTLYIIESTMLTFQCITYYINIFKSSKTLILSQDPIFWITTGLSFVMLGIMPFNLMQNYLMAQYPIPSERLQTVTYLAYCLFFTIIIKAYLCRQHFVDKS
jgi:hypothetical protein